MLRLTKRGSSVMNENTVDTRTLTGAQGTQFVDTEASTVSV
jgi:hypothetical protein